MLCNNNVSKYLKFFVTIIIMSDRYLIEAVKEIYKIKNEKLAEEIARSIEVYIEVRGLRSYRDDLERSVGKKYAAERIVESYRRKFYNY